MKNILFTLALLISFNLFSQSNSELISKFNNDLFLSYQYIFEGDYDNALDLMNPDIFNFVSKEQLIQSFEIMSGETDIGIKITTDKPYVTKISERFDFGGYKYYRIFKKSSMEMQIINEDFLLNIENIKATLENQYSQIADSIKFDSNTNTFIIEGAQSSTIASSEINNDDWKYIEYKTDSQRLGMLNQMFPAEVMEKLSKPSLLISFNSFGQTEEKITYYESGAVESKSNYVDGLRQGEGIGYYESGAIQYKVNYVDGLLQGEGIGYYKSGAVESKVNYVDDKRQGELIGYYENGEIKGIDNYKDGELIKD